MKTHKSSDWLVLFACVAVFLAWILIPAIKCADSFCMDDSLYYYFVIERGMSAPFDWTLVFQVLRAVELVVGPVWAIRLVAAILSVIFFLVMCKIMEKMQGKRAISAIIFAGVAVLSPWWMRISMGLYKNELAIVILAAMIYFLIHRKSDFREKILTLFSGLVLLGLTHASTAYFAVLSTACALIVYLIMQKKLKYAFISTIAVLGILVAGVVALNMTIEQTDSVGYESLMTILLIYIVSAPAAIAGVFYLREQKTFGVFRASIVLGVVVAGIIMALTPGVDPNWTWRFVINSAFCLIILVSMGFEIALRHKNSSIIDVMIRMLIFTSILSSVVIQGYYTSYYLEEMVPTFTLSQIDEFEDMIVKSGAEHVNIAHYIADIEWVFLAIEYNGTNAYSECGQDGANNSILIMRTEYAEENSIETSEFKDSRNESFLYTQCK